MASDWQEPEWACPPRTDIDLEILKGGLVVGKLSLNDRSHYTLGRQAGAVHVQLDHPSISRQHAVLQYGKDGALFLLDRGSTHGTFVNKQRLEPNVFRQLNVGDVVRFGESTRLYAVCGPEELMPPEYDSENLQKYRVMRKLLDAKLKAAGVKAGSGEGGSDGEGGGGGASWGFDEDAPEEESEGEGEGDSEEDEEQLPDYLKTEAQKAKRKELKMGIKEDDVHAKDQKAFQNLQKKMQKIEHLLIENERITAKEGSQGGLTAGQQQQVDRNMQRLAALREQVDSIEDTIRQKNKQRTSDKAAASAAKEEPEAGAAVEAGGERTEGTDDYYDRTSSSKAGRSKADIKARRFAAKMPVKGILVASAAKAHTYETLVAKQAELQAQLSVAMASLTQLDGEEAAAAAAAQAGAGGDGGDSGDGDAQMTTLDSLDAFLLSNEADARSERRQEMLHERDRIEAELRQTAAVMKLAQPALPTLKPSAALATSTPSLATGFSLVKRGHDGAPADAHKAKRVKFAEPTATANAAEGSEPEAAAPAAPSAGGGSEGSAKTAALLAAASALPRTAHTPGTSSPDFVKHAAAAKARVQRRGPMGPARPGDAALPGAAGAVAGGERRLRRAAGAAAAAGNADGIGREETWVPPKGQSGDGKTALNAKLGY